MAGQSTREQLFSDAPLLCEHVTHRTLTANTAESVAIPSWAEFVIISPSSAITDYYVNANTTATVPTTDSDAGTSSMCSPTYRRVSGSPGSRTFSIISEQAGVVTFEWYGRSHV